MLVPFKCQEVQSQQDRKFSTCPSVHSSPNVAKSPFSDGNNILFKIPNLLILVPEARMKTNINPPKQPL